VKWRDGLLILCLAGIIFGAAHGAGILDPWQANDDTRQQVFWMQRFSDPSLYPNDPLSTYASYYVPQALQLLYRLAAPVAPAILFSKILTGVLFVLLSLSFYGLGCAIGGKRLGWCLTATTWLMPAFLYNMSGGISRSFAAPLTVLFLWRWAKGDTRGQALALFLQALFIPYAFITCAAASLLARLCARLKRRLEPKPFPAKSAHWLVLALGMFLVWLMNHRFNAAGYGPLASVADMRGHPEFSAMGRLELYPQPGIFMDALYYPFERIGVFLEWGLIPGIASLAVLAGYLFWEGRRVPWRELLSKARPAVWLTAAGGILYIAARVMLLRLFVPDRYLTIPLTILYALGIAAVAASSVKRLKKPLTVALLAVCIVLSFLRLHGQGLFDYSAHASCYEAVRALPADVTLAGPPRLMDDIMTFGQRKALVTYKLAHVWSLGWWRWYEPRLRALFSAYYADDPGQVRDFCRSFGVNYLVVDENDFSPQAIADHPFFAPFDAFIQSLTKGRTHFALLDFPYTRIGKTIRLIRMTN